MLHMRFLSLTFAVLLSASSSIISQPIGIETEFEVDKLESMQIGWEWISSSHWKFE